MSERIKELIAQAMIEAPHEMGGKYKAFSKEKFAELIIKECVHIANEYVREGGASQTAESLIGKRIKEHFGVK